MTTTIEVPGYEVCKTRERVEGSGDGVFVKLAFWFPKWRAIGYARRFQPPGIPSYRLEIVKVGFLRWHVVAFQNVLVPKK
jgi:hypothetical protein